MKIKCPVCSEMIFESIKLVTSYEKYKPPYDYEGDFEEYERAFGAYYSHEKNDVEFKRKDEEYLGMINAYECIQCGYIMLSTKRWLKQEKDEDLKHKELTDRSWGIFK